MIFFAVPVHKLPVSGDENGECKKIVRQVLLNTVARAGLSAALPTPGEIPYKEG